ncbi:aminotransferase class I/II-fold pyridoxal phosphate-dependent enzyme [Nitrincola sp. MINF-07-Sa-05]|uniref:aminotransferase class I/II-fold pyridoxal phosphate-dependent enzyme n=1 Tax=Nitrincola salilacus TaxID=3400273 RepID=UPI0039182D16
MKKTGATELLKQKLIEQSLKRKLKVAEKPTTAGLFSRGMKDLSAYTDFASHPGHKQIRLIREGSALLGVPDPFFRVHEGSSGATAQIGGKTYLNFSSYNYLGLSGHPEVNRAAKAAIDTYGTSVSASRMVSGERPLHQMLEAELARAYQCEDALVFVSGHATNVSTLGYLLGPKDLVLHDEFIHNSTLVGAELSGARRISFKHNDTDALESILSEQRDRYERVLIVTEGLFSMDGDIPDLPKLISLKKRYHAWLMVDEAHSFGVLGKTGLGIREHFSLESSDVDIWMGTLSKSLASCGGYIAGNRILIEMLRHFAPGFLYSVGMPAPQAAASLAALEVMEREPDRVHRLHRNSMYFMQKLKSMGFNIGAANGYAVVPLITGSSLKAGRMTAELFENGINVQPILYPAIAEKSARLRFFISGEHTEEQLEQALNSIKQLKIR